MKISEVSAKKLRIVVTFGGRGGKSDVKGAGGGVGGERSTIRGADSMLCCDWGCDYMCVCLIIIHHQGKLVLCTFLYNF